jgi:hypothetical protein
MTNALVQVPNDACEEVTREDAWSRNMWRVSRV